MEEETASITASTRQHGIRISTPVGISLRVNLLSLPQPPTHQFHIASSVPTIVHDGSISRRGTSLRTDLARYKRPLNVIIPNEYFLPTWMITHRDRPLESPRLSAEIITVRIRFPTAMETNEGRNGGCSAAV